MRQRAALGLATCLLLLAAGLAAGAAADDRTAMGAARPCAFLVRHAEKDTAGGADPALTPEGTARAARLAELLAGEPIARVYVTDTRRARDTAAPFAARLGLPVELYDAKKLPDLAARLRERQETALVVGHSNTTDELAVALGGESAGPIRDEEHDRLYRVDLEDGSTVVRRY